MSYKKPLSEHKMLIAKASRHNTTVPDFKGLENGEVVGKQVKVKAEASTAAQRHVIMRPKEEMLSTSSPGSSRFPIWRTLVIRAKNAKQN